MEIRWMIRNDLEQVLDIERLCFEYPWEPDDFTTTLRQSNSIGMVAVDQGRVVGYMIYALHKDEIELLNFAVNPSCWRQYIGFRMADKLIHKLEPRRRVAIRMCVRESNLAAQLFWKSQGFRCVGVLRQLYELDNEDALEFRYELRDIQQPYSPANRIREFLHKGNAE